MFMRRILNSPRLARWNYRQTSPRNRSLSTENSGSSSSPSSSIRDSVISVISGVVLISGGGMIYHDLYKMSVLNKIERAFEKGYDPILELSNASTSKGIMGESDGGAYVERKEQPFIDDVINGEWTTGSYLLILGAKGIGKTSLIVNSMRKNHADGVAYFESHENDEIFRLRLGKALEFEYNEDSFGGLFSRKEPRETSALLDIERALNKLEKVAIRSRKAKGRPLTLVINNLHFLRDDAEGHSLLHMLQQRAESWAQSGVLTMVFVSDDHSIYEYLKKNASRMHVLSVQDLSPSETHSFLATSRASAFPSLPSLDEATSRRVWNKVGGRLNVLSQLVKEADLDAAVDYLISSQKAWLMSRLGLIPDLDDDVMDEQKMASCSLLLFQEFARIAQLDEDAGVVDVLPDVKLEYRRAREVMTRTDFLHPLDHHNIIAIDLDYYVRPDSQLMLSVFRSIVAEPDFQEKLDNVRARIDEIEALHRTSELTIKSAGDLEGVLKIQLIK